MGVKLDGPPGRPPALVEFLAAGRHALAHHSAELGLFYLRLCLVLDPAWPEVIETLAAATAQTGADQRGCQLLDRIIHMGHGSAALWLNRAIAAEKLADTDQSLWACRAIADAPSARAAWDVLRRGLPPGRSRLGAALNAAQLEPDSADAHMNAAIAYGENNQTAPSKMALAKALALSPDLGAQWRNASVLLSKRQGDIEPKAARRAVVLDPKDALAWSHWGLAADALAPPSIFRAIVAVCLDPGLGTAWYNAANILCPSGRADVAVRCLNCALAIDPNHEAAWHNLLMNMHYVPKFDRARLFDLHNHYGQRFAQVPRPGPRPRPNGAIRVGFVSGDFRRHSVSYFLLPFLQSLNPDRVDAILFANNAHLDEISEKLSAASSAFISIAGMSDAQARMVIADQQIDVLVDLAGYTGGNRISLMALRPAPIQATWLGYPDTLGLSAIDYRLTDWLADPPDADDFAVENLVRIDGGFLAYGNESQVDPGPCPFDQSGHITFGSFNNLAKMTPDQAGRFAAIVKAVPKSRLLLKAMAFSDPIIAAEWRARFVDLGLAPAQIDLRGWVGVDDHLAHYREMDIALDTYPYAGTTTTCEALWMGVPVVSLVGETHAARMGLSLLSRVGLEDLAVADETSFVATASALAQDHTRRRHLRRDLRSLVQQGDLGDAGRLARAFEDLCTDWLSRLNAG
jgi:predicted O-linked N-acetylglucosamine transferase (SPINDLY family)